MDLNLLEKSILATIIYYDILDYPLTGFEVFKYLINPLHVVALTESGQNIQLEPLGSISLFDVLKTLKNKPLQKFIGEKNGFYFLKGRQHLYEQRIERQKIAAPRWKKVYKILRVLQVCPFVRMIAVCNSLAIDNSKEEADIDFFIIIKKGRIWLTRFLVTLLVWLMGEWRHKKKIAGKICLSFYITDESLNLETISIKPYDIYLANWISQLKPVYYQGQMYRDFIFKNLWNRNYLVNFGKFFNYHHPEFKKNEFLSSVKDFLEKILKGWFGNLIEKITRFLQKKRISHKLTQHEVPTAVVVSDKMLKFHENDKRNFFQEQFDRKLKLIL
ncbi:MAG: hypothetical protein ACOZAL_00455 [Patescibacteria group bacterium]